MGKDGKKIQKVVEQEYSTIVEIYCQFLTGSLMVIFWHYNFPYLMLYKNMGRVILYPRVNTKFTSKRDVTPNIPQCLP